MPDYGRIERATCLLSSGIAPGSDYIPSEIYEECSRILTDKLHQPFQVVWQFEALPQDSMAHLEQSLLPENQSDFQKGCGTIHMVFAARQVQ